MADEKKKMIAEGSHNRTREMIDPLYQRYMKSVVRSLSSMEFYDFFMAMMESGDNKIQFSNRKVEKTVDLKWVDAIEETLPAFQHIISMPRNIIKEEELVVNVANARKAGADVVRHLAQHASLVDDYTQDTGDVRPNKLMQKYREESQALYENRVAFTVMEQAMHFVKIRYDALTESMGEEFGAKVKMQTDMENDSEYVHMDMFMHVRERDDIFDTDAKNADVLDRIARLYRVLRQCMGTEFAQILSKENRVKGGLVRTNVLKKNPQYKKIAKLWDFLREYKDVGYSIRIIEQNPQVDDTFRMNLYHNVLFSYIVLKGYLADERDREIPGQAKGRKRKLKPKFIHEIIEEITQDYDLPDVEIRKVLIEELTKAQLMQEEAAERRRLVEEQAQRKKEEAERLRAEKEAERERIRQEKEAEKERIRQEKEAEKERLRQEQLARENEDRRRGDIFRKELEAFAKHLPAQLEARAELEEQKRIQQEKQDYENAVRLMEEEEQRRKEERQRLRQQKEAERLRKLREEQEEQERLRLEKERAEQEAREEAERQRIAEEQRLEAQARKVLRIHIQELSQMEAMIAQGLQERQDYQQRIAQQKRLREEQRQQRRAQRTGK